MHLSLHDIRQQPPGETVSGMFAVARFEARSSDRAGRFGLLTLSDITGTMGAKLWNMQPVQEALLQANRYLKISGCVNLYQNEKQIIVQDVTAPAESEVRERLKYLVPHADCDLEEIYRDMLAAAEGISHIALRRTVLLLIRENPEISSRFRLYPGALSYHHAVVGGLMQHTHEVLAYAQDFCRRDSALNQDMMTALAILHDIGKVEELAVDPYGLPIGFTKEGKLLGHIALGLKLVNAAGAEAGLDRETDLLLQHGIYSHHGAPEWGSPVLPKTKEAQLIHYLDNISAKNDQFEAATRQMEGGSFSPYDRGLQREIYKP